MPIASGTFTRLAVKKQSALGTPASGASAQILRRVTIDINKKKAFYKSNEIRASQQRSDGRHGMVSVDGAINGELSVGTYQLIMGSALRSSAWSTAITASTSILITAAPTSGAFGTFTTTGPSYLTTGYKIGMTVRWTGWAVATANNAHNFVITALTATVMTGYMLDGVAVVARAAGDAVAATEVGKNNSIPLTGHVRDYWTIEKDYADLVRSEQYTDCVFGGVNIKLPASGLATIDFPVIGLDMTVGTASVFTSPTAASTGKVLASANGAVFVAGLRVATITSLDISINANNAAPGGTVGSNVDSDIFTGVFDISGNMSVFFDSVTMRDYFLAETEVSIIAVFTTDNTPASAFMSFIMPVCKINGADKSDGETGLTMTMPFVVLENTAGGAGTNSVNTSIVIQDSAAV